MEHTDKPLMQKTTFILSLNAWHTENVKKLSY